MSDGEDGGDGNPPQMITEMKRKFKDKHNIICHTVGFGSGIQPGTRSATLLQQMATNGEGKSYSANTAIDLQEVFGKIAANSTTSDELIERFSEILAKNISMKITDDYF
ncbi:unnamed protein product [Rotaria sp. Silwood2]|nr:unnamed protein product [Rotaria sp. Silwood2]